MEYFVGAGGDPTGGHGTSTSHDSGLAWNGSGRIIHHEIGRRGYPSDRQIDSSAAEM
jgi:hypothetical protein